MNTKKYLLVNSSDREYGSTSDFKIKLPHSLHYQHCELIYVMIPNTFYNITAANNTLLYNNIAYSVYPGNYNFDELIQTIIDILPAGVGVKFDDTEGKLTIQNDTPFTLSFPNTGSINYILGFDPLYNVVNSSDHYSINTVSIADTELFIEINELSSNFMTSGDTYYSPTFCISNNGNKNDMLQWYKHSTYPQECTIKDNNLQWLTIRLKNQYGEILQKVGEWSMLIHFY